MALATLAELKSFLEITATTHDTRLTDALTRAQSILEAFCQRKFDEDDYTEQFDGGGATLILRHFPVDSVASVNDDLERVFGVSTIVDATTYSVNKESGIVKLDEGLIFLPGNRSVQVEYTAGYGGTYPVPGALKQAVIIAAAALFEERKNIGVASRALGEGGSTTYRHGVPKEVFDILESFRSRRVK